MSLQTFVMRELPIITQPQRVTAWKQETVQEVWCNRWRENSMCEMYFYMIVFIMRTWQSPPVVPGQVKG